MKLFIEQLPVTLYWCVTDGSDIYDVNGIRTFEDRTDITRALTVFGISVRRNVLMVEDHPCNGVELYIATHPAPTR